LELSAKLDRYLLEFLQQDLTQKHKQHSKGELVIYGREFNSVERTVKRNGIAVTFT